MKKRSKKPEEKDLKQYWNRRAATFPRFEEGEDNYEAGVLRRIKEQGIDFRGKKVLDLGCGSGMYTIRIAREAEKVIALDISDEMLKILQEDAQALGLSNIETINSDWLDFKGREKYDIIFCSMTPALRSVEGRAKLKEYAADWVVYMGFISRHKSKILEELYKLYGIEMREMSSAIQMREWLDSEKADYSFLPIEGEWVKKRSADEMLNKCMNAVYSFDIEPDRKEVENLLKKYKGPEGNYAEITSYEIALITWKNK